MALRRRASTAAVGMAVASLLLGACGESEYAYVKSSADRTYLRIPRSWKLFDEDQILRAVDLPDDRKAEFKERSWSVAFDASPEPSLDHLLMSSPHPTGLAQTRRLSPAERDEFSLASLRSVLLPSDPLSAEARESGVEVVRAREVRRSGGFRGSELVVNIRGSRGETTFHQIALVDPGTSAVHVLAVACEPVCYKANEKVIREIIDSWTVKER